MSNSDIYKSAKRTLFLCLKVYQFSIAERSRNFQLLRIAITWVCRIILSVNLVVHFMHSVCL